MWIGLLGPLDIITTAGQRAYLPAAKQRAALAALAVDARDVVPVDALAAAIWHHEIPPSWRTTIRNYIRRLRTALGTDGYRIVTRPSGYLLQAGDDEIDVLTFQSLRKAGLAAAREGDWTRASATFSDAEALWRGTPFADITSPGIRDAHLPYLRETLLAVLEARIDADLRLWPPRAADVIPELQRLTSRHPERERLWGQLMLALYRCGRQSDALVAFRAARKFCVGELGIEPGRDLTDLQQRIITADSGLLGHASQPRRGFSGRVVEPRDTGAIPALHAEWSSLAARAVQPPREGDRMPHRLTRWLAGAAIAAVTATSLALAPPPAQASPLTADATAVPAYTPPPGVTDPCQAATAGTAGCAVLTAAPGTHKAAAVPALGTTPTGYTPTNLTGAYQLPSGMATGAKVAVVTAYDDPNAAADLGTYRAEYGLAACTTASGCFDKVSETGGTTYPKASAGWSAGAAESIDMISAICSTCEIILVEASSSAITDLGTAENEAVTLGAKFITNDWTIPESEIGSAETTYDANYFDHPGVAITAPAGDGGYGVSYPAASPYVTAVGGTTLTADSTATRGWDESTWSGTGSGCSAYEPKPTWQTDTGCTTRTDNDAAAVADPSTPVAYYDTPTAGGWGAGSGTAVAAAIIAAAYALAGAPAPGSTPASYLYTHPGALHNITTGTNGTCSVTYLCTAGTGYSGPDGMGTPYADTAFHTVGARPADVTATSGVTWSFVTSTSGAIEYSSLPSGSSTWSALTSLGSDSSGYPGALAATDGSVWVFGLANGHLWGDQLPSNSTTWSGWTNLGTPASEDLVGTPVIVQDKSKNIDVFVRGATTGNLYLDELPGGTGTWGGFSDLGGNFPNDVSAGVGAGGFTAVVGIGNDSNLYQDSRSTAGIWSGWTGISGAAVTGVPALIQDHAGTWRIYARRSADGAMVADAEGANNTWSGSSLGGTWVNDPTALGASGGTDWVFAVGLTSAVYDDNLATSGTWTGWVSVGSSFGGVPSFTEDASGNFHLVDVTPSGALEANKINSGSSTWLGWTTIGTSLAGS